MCVCARVCVLSCVRANRSYLKYHQKVYRTTKLTGNMRERWRGRARGGERERERERGGEGDTLSPFIALCCMYVVM